MFFPWMVKKEVYKTVGVAATSYDAWESGQSVPNLERAVKLSKVLETPLYSLCVSLGLDMEGVPQSVIEGKPSESDCSKSSHDSANTVEMTEFYKLVLNDYRVLAEVILGCSADEVAAILRVIKSSGSTLSPPPPH